jgi:hypothetical protein
MDKLAMTLRNRLPNRRRSENFNVEVGGLRYQVSFSRFPGSDQIAEVFINNHRSNSSADTNARDCGILLSVALQYGADLTAIRHAVSPGGLVAAVLDEIGNE